jgi:carbamoyl-phosphate synthase large subunit
MKILITGVGGPTPRSFAIALKKYSVYKRFELIGTDINPLAIGLYQDALFNKSYIVPKASDPDYWKVIDRIIKENDIEFAVINPELEVMEWSKRQAAGTLPCKVLLPDTILTELFVDKSKMTELLKDLDVVPPSVEFQREETNFKPIFDKLGKGFWVRSTSGTSGLGSLKINSEEDLKNWIKINPTIQTFLASKFLPGRNLACKMLYYEGTLVRAAIGERVNYIMAKVAPSGITGNTSFGRLLNDPYVFEESKRAMDYIFKTTGAKKHGFFTADLKEDENGKPYITEVNVRHVAFNQLFAAAGANFAEDTMRLLNDDPTFDRSFQLYEFDRDLIFLRDVDSLPILMKESELLHKINN